MGNWGQILEEIKSQKESGANAVDEIRRKYLKQFHEIAEGRNVIAYYSGFLSKPEMRYGLELNHEDKNGFMMALHGLDYSKGLDLILHTPGGDISATQSIVHYLRKKFGNDIRAIVPQIAMSAGTMIACSCKEILMCRHSNLGPIDPQVGNMPAYGIVEEFKRAYAEIKKDNAKILVWRPILEKYQPAFLTHCENAIKWSDSFVEEQLKEIMFKGTSNAAKHAKKIVKSLSNYRKNKMHNNPLHYEVCKEMGLKIKLIEDEFGQEFQDALLTVHHCFMHSLMNTGSYKMIENHNGIAFVKQIQIARMVA